MRVAVAVAALLIANACYAGEKSPWEEFGAALVGQWKATITLEEDVPELGEEGDALEGEAKCRWILKKSAIQVNSKLGKVPALGVVTWDAAEEHLCWNWVDAVGTVGRATGTKKKGNWVWKSTVSRPSGERETSTSTLVISDGGKTHTWKMTSRKLGDESLPDRDDVWKSVKK